MSPPEVPASLAAHAQTSSPGIRSATIDGGGCRSSQLFIEADYGAIGGAILACHLTNVIGGGRDNQRHAESATIAGGFRNNIGTNAFVGTIGGGVLNAIQTNVSAATIGGGDRNVVAFSGGTISGGVLNRAEGGPYPTVGEATKMSRAVTTPRSGAAG